MASLVSGRNRRLNDELRAAFRDRRVLVTGHTGFKGSWLVIWLSQLGARLAGYSLPPASQSNFSASRVRDLLFLHQEADIRDRHMLTRTIEGFAPEIVFHLAAQPLVLEGLRNPFETFDVNVRGTLTLLECLRTTRQPCVVLVVTSDKCYANRTELWGYRESDPLGGEDPYGASKAAAELVAAAYRCSFGGKATLRIATARAGNVIGGGDWAPDRIVPDTVRALMSERPLRLRSANALRPWQHVLEPIAGYLTLAAKLQEEGGLEFAGPWNFGPLPGPPRRVKDLVAEIGRCWGTAVAVESAGGVAHELPALRLSSDKAVSLLGWTPRWDWRTTIEKTVAWYKRCSDVPGASMLEACCDDISDYETGVNAN